MLEANHFVDLTLFNVHPESSLTTLDAEAMLACFELKSDSVRDWLRASLNYVDVANGAFFIDILLSFGRSGLQFLAPAHIFTYVVDDALPCFENR